MWGLVIEAETDGGEREACRENTSHRKVALDSFTYPLQIELSDKEKFPKNYKIDHIHTAS